MKNADDLPYLFQRFLDGKSTSQELNQLFDHFNTSDESELRLLIQDEMEHHQETGQPDASRQRTLERLYQGIAHRIDSTPETKNIIKLWQVAAAVAAMLILVAGYYWEHSPSQIKYNTVFAANGKRMEVQLPDSSRVWLNSGTTLQYPLAFSTGERTVTIKNGEAYFEVIHKEHSPFTVHTGNIKVVVLGTSFDVSAYEKEKTIEVTVGTGKVGLLRPASNKNTNFLLPGDRAMVNKGSYLVRVTKVDPADVGSWRNDQLIFENEPLSAVLNTLERTYNVHIRIGNKHLLTQRVTMRLDHQPLDNVLTAMSFSNHFTFTKIDEQLVIVK